METDRFLLVRGTDEYAIQKRAKAFLNVFSDPTSEQMNSAWLDLTKQDINAVRDTAYSMPFLAPMRLVVIENGIHPFTGNAGKTVMDAYRKNMLALLTDLPESTKIAITQIEDAPARKSDKPDDSRFEWLLSWKNANGEHFSVETYSVPTDEVGRRKWLAQTANSHGISLQENAISALLAFAGEFNPRSVDTDLQKLGAYVNYNRIVGLEDVKAVCVPEQAFKIFDLTDAIGNKDLAKAIMVFRAMAVDSDVQGEIFPMIVRQFRLILQVAYLREKTGKVQDVSKIGGLANSFVANRIIQQAQKFSLTSLRNMYQALMDLDVAMKLSKVDAATGVEMFIIESSSSAEFPSRPILEPRPLTAI